MIVCDAGPAHGEIFELARTPVLLRVVRNRGTGKWDALDQLEDRASVFEDIHVYRLAGQPTHAHISCRPRSRSRWISIATYRYLEPVADADVRENAAWASWCERNRARLEEIPCSDSSIGSSAARACASRARGTGTSSGGGGPIGGPG